MKHQITVEIDPANDLKRETAKLSLHDDQQANPFPMDVNGASLLKVSWAIPDLGQDFFCIAACIYAADKAIARNKEEDKWTRDIAIEIPVEHETRWSNVAARLSECVGFLTGDVWDITFSHASKRLIQKKPRTRRLRHQTPTGQAVCLFSGGLDSFIGAIDWLSNNPEGRLLAVGHYDRHVGGPGADQERLRDVCFPHFGSRFKLAQTQVGLFSKGNDTNYRSRSLLFLALGCYFAEVLGPTCPVFIPENGPIALNFPLTPSRRGSCSTRTVHPYFIAEINSILRDVGINNPISNPFELKTKGEMVDQCRASAVLTAGVPASRSCAKFNRRTYWTNRNARGCGTCIPCLFRRASLHQSGRDTELYGNRVEDIADLEDTPSDVLSLVSFLRRSPSDREIASGLLANGRLPMDKLNDYVALVKRMRAEVLAWLRSAGSPYLKNEVRAC